MGFFKSIGKKLKRVVSIKNLTRVATGNFSAVGKDILRVASTDNLGKDPITGRSIIVPAGSDLKAKPLEMPKVVETVLDAKGAELRQDVIDSLSKNKAVQDATDMVAKTALKAYWTKYKNWFIGFLVALLMFFGLRWLFFSKGKKSRARR